MTMRSPVWFVARMIGAQPMLYAVNALCWILYHTFPIWTGLLARLFFDLLAGKAPAGWNLATLVALVVAAGLAKAGVIWVANRTGTPYRFRGQSLLQRNLLDHLLRRPPAGKGSPGEALSTLRDDVEAAHLLSEWVYDAAAALLFAGGALGVLLSVNARVTLLVFAPLVTVVALAHTVRVRLVRAREESRVATARVTGAIGEIFGAVQTIQTAGAAGRAVAYLDRLGAERQRAAIRDRLQGLWLDGLFESTASLGAGLILLAAAAEIRAGQFTVGDFALFASYLMTVVDFTAFVGYLINSWRQAGVSYGRLLAMLQGAPSEALVSKEPPPHPPAAVGERLEQLDVERLTYIHPGSDRGIRNISFRLERGTLTVITGRIGSGKSTLLRALLGILPPQAGQVRWNGRSVSQLKPPLVAYTPQVPVLVSGTLRENILLGWPAGDSQVEQAVRQAVLAPDLAGMEAGLETLIGARGVRLSGGQIQRTAAARMLVREPELLIFDDLSSALDAETEQALWRHLLEQGATCLAVSHRPEVLARAHQVIQLDS